MFILMCGLPFCGKSTAINMIVEKTDLSICVIRPEDWLPHGIDNLAADEEKTYRIECWRTALSTAEVEVEKRDPSEIIILDCANSKFKPLESLLRRAKRNGHRLAVLYVNARPIQCAVRAGDHWVGSEVVGNYIENIKNSLPKFKNKCDQIIIIENTDTLSVFKQNVFIAWSRLCPIT